APRAGSAVAGRTGGGLVDAGPASPPAAPPTYELMFNALLYRRYIESTSCPTVKEAPIVQFSTSWERSLRPRLPSLRDAKRYWANSEIIARRVPSSIWNAAHRSRSFENVSGGRENLEDKNCTTTFCTSSLVI